MFIHVILLLLAGAAAAPAKPPGVAAAHPPQVDLRDVAKYVNKTVTVSFVVRSLGTSREALLILNSKEDPRDKENFAVLVLREDLDQFGEANLTDAKTAAARFKNKSVNATGKISRRKDGRYQLVVRKHVHLQSPGPAS